MRRKIDEIGVFAIRFLKRHKIAGNAFLNRARKVAGPSPTGEALSKLWLGVC